MNIVQVRPTEQCSGPTCGTMAELSLNGTFYCLFHGGQRLIAHELDRMAAHAREGWALAAAKSISALCYCGEPIACNHETHPELLPSFYRPCTCQGRDPFKHVHYSDPPHRCARCVVCTGHTVAE